MPTAVIQARAVQRLNAGHQWIYQSDLVKAPQSAAGLVRVVAPRTGLVGRCLYSPKSQIALRLWQRSWQDFELTAQELLCRRLKVAVARRRRVMPKAVACRWVHGEADFLPGLFVDGYGDCLVVQATCAGAETLLEVLVEALVRLLKPRSVVVRNDSQARLHEGLAPATWVAYGEEPGILTLGEGLAKVEIDVVRDHKTGSFLDQALNHTRVGRYAQGLGLDVFCYHGGFAFGLAPGCTEVLGIDSAQAAIDRARSRALCAKAAHVRFEVADAFSRLAELVQGPKRFNVIVVDPPALASTKRTKDKAWRAYKELNRRALQLLAPLGVLITGSCSQKISQDDLDGIVTEAGREARRPLQRLERWGAAPDHPVLMGMPETEYLNMQVVMAVQ